MLDPTAGGLPRLVRNLAAAFNLAACRIAGIVEPSQGLARFVPYEFVVAPIIAARKCDGDPSAFRRRDLARDRRSGPTTEEGGFGLAVQGHVVRLIDRGVRTL